MSSIPPPPPAVPVLPWEDHRTFDRFRAFVDSAKLFVFRPDEAWALTPEKGGIESPLIFGWIMSFLGLWIGFIYRRMFLSPFGQWLPALPRGMGGAFPWGPPRSFGCSLVLFPFIAAFTAFIGMFIVAAVVHLCVMIVGGSRSSTSGFEGTFRVIAYAEVASIARLVPFVGGLIALVWWVLLAVKGLVRMHRTTPGRALAAVLLPIAAVVLVAVVAGAALIALFVAAGHASSRSL